MTRVGGKAALAFGLLAAGGLLAWSLGGRLAAAREAAASLSLGWSVAAALAALASHAMAGFALSAILAQLGHRLGAGAVLGIALVSTTANYLVSAGGLTGFALKAHLLHRRGVPIADTVAASAVTSAMLYAVLAAILALGVATIGLGGARVGLLECLAGLGALIVASGGILALFFNGSLRVKVARMLFHWSNRAAWRLAGAELPQEGFLEFEKQMASGLARVRHGHGRLTLAVVYTCLDWGLALLSLWFCFEAVGVMLPPGPLSAAFAVGQGATLIPVLPGGLGAAEGSTAALLEALGYEGGRALVAALLYRLVYYMVPAAASVFVFLGLKASDPVI